jgi:cyclopropane-fatty-acyl-phospholipid synthase
MCGGAIMIENVNREIDASVFRFRTNKSNKIIVDLFSYADVKINSSRPWDMQVYNKDLYRRVLKNGSLGLGESYMDGWWDAKELDAFFYKTLRAKLDKKIPGGWIIVIGVLIQTIFNSQRLSKSFEVGERHYDIGNDLYENMLDKRMVYSCGYWKNTSSLDEAQEAKLDLICRKLQIEEGMKVLDIGCGWGGFAKFVSEKYGAIVDGVTVSKEQVEFARKSCRDLPVQIKLQDYRHIEGQYDRIISIGMFEHVGCKNYRSFMKVVNRLLSNDGLFLLHTIGRNSSVRSNDPWVEKYIFPNSMLPSIKQIGISIENLFVMEDWHNFSTDYDKTLMAWFENFDLNWEKLKSKYSDRFYRMWKYYLLVSAGSFRARHFQLWQKSVSSCSATTPMAVARVSISSINCKRFSCRTGSPNE